MTECYLKPDVCAECGGECCKNLPGAAMPEDFPGDLFTELVKAFKTGKWAVDWWEGDPREDKMELSKAYFIRPATTDSKFIYDPAWSPARCVFLADAGCELEPEKRPTGCRLLEPKHPHGHCEAHGATKQQAAIAWLPYTEIIEAAVSEAEEE